MAAKTAVVVPDADAEKAAAKVSVKRTQLEKAVRALLQIVSRRTANANPLFDQNSETMTLTFTLSRVPERRIVRPVMIPLPHPMYNEKSEVCFFSKDPQKNYKELILRKHPVPGVTKVIGIDKLKRNYKTPDLKRALADSFDLFLCDTRVVEFMPGILGKVFYTSKLKRPIDVRLKEEEENPTASLQQAMRATPFRVPSGPCIGVKIGWCSMSEEELVKNAAAVIAAVPKIKYIRSNPVQTIQLQATNAPALPVWRRPPPPGAPVHLKKLGSDVGSSSASDAGVSGGSETEDTDLHSSTVPSDAGETLSTRDTSSEIGTAEASSEIEAESSALSQSELDSEVGDVDARGATSRDKLPLVRDVQLRRKRKKQQQAPVSPAKKPKKRPDPQEPAAAPAPKKVRPPVPEV